MENASTEFILNLLKGSAGQSGSDLNNLINRWLLKNVNGSEAEEGVER